MGAPGGHRRPWSQNWRNPPPHVTPCATLLIWEGATMYVDLEADNQRKGPSATLNVDPAKLTQIQQGFEAEAERIQTWIRDNHRMLTIVDATGGDGCSRHMARDLGRTGQSAIDAAEAYVERLQTAALKLSESAKDYQLQEEHNAANFRQDHQ